MIVDLTGLGDLFLPISVMFPLAVGIVGSVITAIGAVGTFAAGAANVIGAFDSPDAPEVRSQFISPAKGAYEAQAMEFLADLYEQIAAQLGYTYDTNGQLIYTPTTMQQYRGAQSAYLAERDMMRHLGMDVPDYNAVMSTEDLTAMYDELIKRRDELAATIGGGIPVPVVAPGSFPGPVQPTEGGPFGDQNLAPPTPPLPPAVDPNDPGNWYSMNPGSV